MYFTLDKSRDSVLENGISYTTVEEQWESNSALKVDKLVTTLLRKCSLNVLVHLLDSPPLVTTIHHRSYASLRIHMC